jgi:hypothetical protein
VSVLEGIRRAAGRDVVLLARHPREDLPDHLLALGAVQGEQPVSISVLVGFVSGSLVSRAPFARRSHARAGIRSLTTTPAGASWHPRPV